MFVPATRYLVSRNDNVGTDAKEVPLLSESTDSAERCIAVEKPDSQLSRVLG